MIKQIWLVISKSYIKHLYSIKAKECEPRTNCEGCRFNKERCALNVSIYELEEIMKLA